jgi:F1F0 ATPase subunit 2
MTNSLPSIVAQLAVGVAIGLLAGAWHFVSLRWNGPLYAQGRAVAALAVQLGRFALTAALLLMLAHAGALALLAGMAGILLARTVAVRSRGTRT